MAATMIETGCEPDPNLAVVVRIAIEEVERQSPAPGEVVIRPFTVDIDYEDHPETAPTFEVPSAPKVVAPVTPVQSGVKVHVTTPEGPPKDQEPTPTAVKLSGLHVYTEWPHGPHIAWLALDKLVNQVSPELIANELEIKKDDILTMSRRFATHIGALRQVSAIERAEVLESVRKRWING